MRIHSLARCSTKRDSSLIGTLFSAWQATTHAWQPVHRSASTTMPHLYGLSAASPLGMHHLEYLVVGNLESRHVAFELGEGAAPTCPGQSHPGPRVGQRARGGVGERCKQLQRVRPSTRGPAPV